MSAAPLTLVQAAAELGGKPRWLKGWLRKHPADKAGEPYYTPVGRDKVFHPADIARIEQAIDEAARRATFIYFVEMAGHIKIGLASNWRKRVSGLQTSSPFEITCLLVLTAYIGLERDLHEKFSAAHVRGEWFKDCPEIRVFIAKGLLSPLAVPLSSKMGKAS
jgi:hypothetical protein